MPAIVTSDAALPKPVTVSLNSAVKLIGASVAGSACPCAWLTVTVGAPAVKVTVLSVLVDAWFIVGRPMAVATSAGTVTITVPAVGHPGDVHGDRVGGAVGAGDRRDREVLVPPAVPVMVTSELSSKSVTGPLNTTV